VPEFRHALRTVSLGGDAEVEPQRGLRIGVPPKLAPMRAFPAGMGHRAFGPAPSLPCGGARRRPLQLRIMWVASPLACQARNPRRGYASPDVLSGRLHDEVDWTLTEDEVIQSREGAD
jgi:hypothetical protein